MIFKLVILTLIPVIEIAFQPLEIPDYRDFKLFDIQFIVDKKNVNLSRRGIWREHSSKKWIRPRFSVDLIKGLQMSRAKPIFHLSSGIPLTFFWGQFL
jgi:hypothetical protein